MLRNIIDVMNLFYLIIFKKTATIIKAKWNKRKYF